MKKLKNVFQVLSAFLVSAFFISSCNNDIISPPLPDNYRLAVYNYSDAHYFFDTLYKTSFVDYFNNTSGVLNPETYENGILMDNSSLEIWIQTDVTVADKRFAVAHTMLKEQPPFGYDSSYRDPQLVEGEIFTGYFTKLNPSDYVVYPLAGFISFKIPLPDNYAAGVTYRTNEGKLFGTPSPTLLPSDTLVLKMIKCRNQSPDATPLAWELKLKNIYRLPVINVSEEGFSLRVVYFQDGTDQNNLPGHQKSLSTMLDIDRYQGNTRMPPPDGIFDFLSGYTVNTQTGDLIFPTLRPFWDNLVREGVDSSYYYKEIYTRRKTDAGNSAISPNANRYFIPGHIDGLTP